MDWKGGSLREPSNVAEHATVHDELRAVAQAAHLLYFEDWSRGVTKFN